MNYEEMTNAELKELCDETEADISGAKNPSKPNKKEMVMALQKHDGTWISPEEEAEMEKTAALIAAADEPSGAGKAGSVGGEKKLTKVQKQRQVKRAKMALQRVIVTSNNRSQTTDVKNVVHYFGWGNSGFLKYQNDRVLLGKPWHVRQGALERIESMSITQSFNDEERNTVGYETIPAYHVVRLPALTDAERRAIGKKQMMRAEAVDVM